MFNILKFRNVDLGLLLIRIALGIVFIAHGWAKFQDMSGTIQFFGRLGVPDFMAYIVTAIELLGGLFLVCGFFVEYIGVLLTGVMLFAIILVKFKKGFVGGYELELTLLLSAISLIFTGGGKYTLKNLFNTKSQ